VVVHPGAAALHISEEAIPGIADTAGHRGKRIDLGGSAKGANDGGGPPYENSSTIATLRAGPVIITLDPEYPTACLIIASDLQPAKAAFPALAPKVRRDRSRKETNETCIGQVVMLLQPSPFAAD